MARDRAGVERDRAAGFGLVVVMAVVAGWEIFREPPATIQPMEPELFFYLPDGILWTAVGVLALLFVGAAFLLVGELPASTWYRPLAGSALVLHALQFAERGTVLGVASLVYLLAGVAAGAWLLRRRAQGEAARPPPHER